MTSKRSFQAASLVGALTLVGVLLTPVSPANAVGYVTNYYMVNQSAVNGEHIDFGDRIAECQSGTPGTTCTIQTTTSASRTVDLDLGASWEWATANLGISSNSTQSTSVSCTSPALESGQYWNAYPIGTRYQYQIRKVVSQYENGFYQTVSDETSGYLYAFDPRENAVYCSMS